MIPLRERREMHSAQTPGPRGRHPGGGPGTGHPPPSALLGGCLAGGGSASRAGQPRSGRRALRV